MIKKEHLNPDNWKIGDMVRNIIESSVDMASTGVIDQIFVTDNEVTQINAIFKESNYLRKNGILQTNKFMFKPWHLVNLTNEKRLKIKEILK